MSLADISKATRIQVKYLEALESGDHRGLPAEVYVRGFLRSYARYLGLEDDVFIKLYDKEKHIRAHLGKEEAQPTQKAFSFGNAWVITPRLLIIISMVVVLTGTFWYLFRELHTFVAEPHLVITTPVSGQTISEGSVNVIGRTDTGTRVFLNDEPLFVDSEGNFQETLTLQPGMNTLRVLATNRFEKTKEVVLTVESSITPATVPPETIPVQIIISKSIRQVTVEVDGVVVWNGPWEGPRVTPFEVRDQIKIRSEESTSFGFRVGNTENAPTEIIVGPDGMEYQRGDLEKLIQSNPVQ